MWISKKRLEALEARVAELEKFEFDTGRPANNGWVTIVPAIVPAESLYFKRSTVWANIPLKKAISMLAEATGYKFTQDAGKPATEPTVRLVKVKK